MHITMVPPWSPPLRTRSQNMQAINFSIDNKGREGGEQAIFTSEKKGVTSDPRAYLNIYLWLARLMCWYRILTLHIVSEFQTRQTNFSVIVKSLVTAVRSVINKTFFFSFIVFVVIFCVWELTNIFSEDMGQTEGKQYCFLCL